VLILIAGQEPIRQKLRKPCFDYFPSGFEDIVLDPFNLDLLI
jgi:hypothetical protein